MKVTESVIMKTVAAPSNRDWWAQHSAAYPHHVILEPGQRVNPVEANRALSEFHQFICVPFDGLQHWGFAEAAGLEAFTTYLESLDAQPR